MVFLLPLLGFVALTMISTWKPQHLQGPTLEYLHTATGLVLAIFYPALVPEWLSSCRFTSGLEILAAPLHALRERGTRSILLF